MTWSGSAVRTAAVAGGIFSVVAVAAMLVVAVDAQTNERYQIYGPSMSHSQTLHGLGIGFTVRDLAPTDVTTLKLASDAGALVTAVSADSAAAKAGVKTGDVVVRFDGETVRSARQLSRLVDETADGREVEAVVMRDGARVPLKITANRSNPLGNDALNQLFSGRLQERLQDMPFVFSDPNGRFQPFSGFGGYADRQSPGRLGVEIQELSGQLGEFFGTPTGVLVTSVTDGSAAKKAGIKAGDVITKVNGRPITGVDNLRQRITGADTDSTVTIVRDRKEQTLTVKLGDGDAPKTIIR